MYAHNLSLLDGAMFAGSTCNVNNRSIRSRRMSSRSALRIDQAEYGGATERNGKTALCGVSESSQDSSMISRVLVYVVAFLLLSSCSTAAVDAFASAGNAGTAAATRPRVPRRVLILPDSRANLANPSIWHHHLKATVLSEKGVETSIQGMPDPYSFNTKRYETFWLNFMANELALCPDTLVVAHGTAADAVLRFVERRQVWGAVLVCPGGEMYHAGERHGRAYVWPRVRRGCQWLAMVCGAGDPIVGEAEARRVKEALGVPPGLFREVSGGQQRLRDRTGSLLEVEELVLGGLSL
ncbi:unnamed protein product [Pylaiella littoralis]